MRAAGGCGFHRLDGAGGGIARTIECNQNIARYLELDERLRRGSDAPPCREPQALARRFLLA